MGHQSYVLLCTETTLSNPPVIQPKSSCDVHLLRSPWLILEIKKTVYSVPLLLMLLHIIRLLFQPPWHSACAWLVIHYLFCLIFHWLCYDNPYKCFQYSGIFPGLDHLILQGVHWNPLYSIRTCRCQLSRQNNHQEVWQLPQKMTYLIGNFIF